MSAILCIAGALTVSLSFGMSFWQIVGIVLLAAGLAPWDPPSGR